MRSAVSKSADQQNLKAMNLVFKNYQARHANLPINKRLELLNEFESDCDKFVEGYNECKELPSGENISMLSDYRGSKESGLKKTGH